LVVRVQALVGLKNLMVRCRARTSVACPAQSTSYRGGGAAQPGAAKEKCMLIVTLIKLPITRPVPLLSSSGIANEDRRP